MSEEKSKQGTNVIGRFFGGTILRFLRWLFERLLTAVVLIAIVLGALSLLYNVTFGTIFTNIGTWFAGFGGQPVDTSGIYVPVVDPYTKLSELTTMRFNYANIITTSTDMPGLLQALYGGRQVLVAVGYIEAGIDMSQLTQEDILFDVETKTLTIRVPAPRLQSCYLDDSKTYVAQRTTGVFAADMPALDTESRRYAIGEFKRLALEGGILTDAQDRAKGIVEDFARAIVGNQVQNVTINVELRPLDPNAPLPETCL